MNLIKKIFNIFKKYYHLKILKRRYYRTGKCLKCGACCQNIYVRHENKLIKTEEEFENIRKNDSYIFYQHIKVIGKDDFGLVFECEKFDKEKKLCKDHKNRPPICINYPSEEIFSFGACLEDNCGYKFEPIISFKEVFSNVSKAPVKEFKDFIEEKSEVK